MQVILRFVDSLTADSLISIFRGEDEMSRLPYVWDYDMTEAEFEATVSGPAFAFWNTGSDFNNASYPLHEKDLREIL